MERLVEFKVKDLVTKEEKVLVVTEMASVEDVLATLSKNHIHGVPVMDRDSNLLGFIDYLDVLSYLLEDIVKQPVSSGGSISDNIQTDDLNQLMKRASRFKASNVLEACLVNRGQTNPTVVVQEDVSVREAMELFAKGVHRLCVARGKLVHAVLTQSTVIAWLLAKPERLGVLRGQSARELGWSHEGKSHKETVLATDLVLDAFMAVKRSFRTSLPVVDENGLFVGVLSSTDIKWLSTNNFAMLQSDVRTFIRDIRSHSAAMSKNYRVTCRPEDTLGTIMEKMAHERVHLVAVVDSNGKLEAVVTLTDIIRAMLKIPYSMD